jgi:hypothetical protein
MNSEPKTERKRGPAVEIFVVIAFLVVWIILQLWVLPRFGVKT